MLCLLPLSALPAISVVSYSLSGTATFVGAENASDLNYVQGQPVPSDYRNIQLSPLAPAPVGGVTGIATSPSPADRSGSYPAVGLNATPPVDLSVSVNGNATNCRQAAFTVTLTPSAPDSNPVSEQVVRVSVVSDVSGEAREVGEALLVLPASGGSISATMEFPLPPGIPATGVSDSITVVADPYNEIPDVNRTNNSVTVLGVC